MTPGQLVSIAFVGSLSLLVGTVGLTAIRNGVRASGVWALAWALLLAAGTLDALGLGGIYWAGLESSLAALVAPVMLLGALLYAKRPIPVALPLLAAISMALRWLAVVFDGAPSTASLALVTEPPFAIVAAWIVARAPAPAGIDRSHRWLAITLGLYGLAEAVGAGLQLGGAAQWTRWGFWIPLAMPLFGLQWAIVVRRARHRFERQDAMRAAQDERLRLLAESSNSMLVEFDERGVLTYVSGNAEAIMGYPAGEAIGRNVLDSFDDDASSPLVAMLRAGEILDERAVLAAPGGPHKARLRDGRAYYYEANRTTYRTPTGELRILVQAHDITDRVLRETALRDSEERLRRAEEIGSFGSWEYRPASNELYWSENLYRIHGLEPGDGPVDRKEIRHLFEPEDLATIRSQAEGLIERSLFPEFVYRVQRANDGETRVLRTLGRIEYDDEGAIERVSGASVDVTEAHALEDTLRRGRAHLDAFVESNVVGVFYARDDGRIDEANDAFLGALGYGPEDLPLDWRKLSPEEYRQRNARAAAGLRDAGTAPPLETAFYDRRGEPVSMVVAAAAIEDDRAIVMALDVSERKRAEAYIAEQHRILEETIAERTRELLASRTRLHESERLATVGTLAAGVAHQINNPIGAILNGTEYALLCADDENATAIFRDVLETNLAEARRCARIVKSMLLFARDEPTEKWVDDLNRVVRTAHRAISAYAQDHDATVGVTTPRRPVHARISPIEIEQALVNVLRNAIESREDGATVEVRLSHDDEQATIEVTDDGSGIHAGDLDQVFDPFYSTRAQIGGTGLGLSVAHGILADHGGSIRAERRAEGGTRVVLTLPVAARREPVEASREGA